MAMVLSSLMKKAAGRPRTIAVLNRAQEAWEGYRDAQLEAMWPFPEGMGYGSVYPVCGAGKRTQLVKDRIAELRSMLETVEGDACSPRLPEQ